MENTVTNLEFEYLHRDEGNYKIHGSIILRNSQQLTPSKATALINEKLIDSQYFYPKDAKISPFKEHTGIGTLFTDWYEFSQFSMTAKSPTDPRSIEDFLQSF